MIYVLGSLNMDLVFDMPYIPSGGETLTSNGLHTYCGGKGANQAAALGKLSSRVTMIGAVGTDSYGQALIKNLQTLGVDTKFVFKRGNDSGLAVILIEKGENRIILNQGANGRLTNADIDKGLLKAKKGDILLTQLEVPVDIVKYALKIAKQKGMTTALNPAPARFLDDEVFELTDIITPNETETHILTGILPSDDARTERAIAYFTQKGVKNVVITLGARGSSVFDGERTEYIPAVEVPVVDTTAAGDTFVGAVCNRLENGFSLIDACKFATRASSITIQRRGACDSIPTIKEVEKIYN